MNIRDQAPAWTIPELMKHWKISRNTLVQILDSGLLPYMNIGARLRGKPGGKKARRYVRVRDQDRINFEHRRAR